jgi:hypothetical protein
MKACVSRRIQVDEPAERKGKKNFSVPNKIRIFA